MNSKIKSIKKSNCSLCSLSLFIVSDVSSKNNSTKIKNKNDETNEQQASLIAK